MRENLPFGPDSLAQQVADYCGSAGGSFYSVSSATAAGQIVLMCEAGQEHNSRVELPTLARWLRVNDRAFLNDGADDVLSYLPSLEQAWVRSLNVYVCVPLVARGELLAMVCSHLPAQLRTSDREQFRSHLQAWARGATIAWQQFVSTRREERDRAAAYRSQQLTTAGQLAASVAHEVRNPLSAVRSIVQLVKDTQPPPERQSRMLHDVIDEVDRIDSAVSGLLGLTRKHETKAVRCDLSSMAADTVRFMQSAAQRNRLRLTFLGNDSVSIRIDAREFRQVLLNVLLNAFEASTPGAAIEVAVLRRQVAGRDVGIVEVRDTGAGISPEVLSRIFDPFFTTKSEGSGLGLAVSQDLLRRHDGIIRVDSTVGVGTVVTLEFPAAD